MQSMEKVSRTDWAVFAKIILTWAQYFLAAQTSKQAAIVVYDMGHNGLPILNKA